MCPKTPKTALRISLYAPTAMLQCRRPTEINRLTERGCSLSGFGVAGFGLYAVLEVRVMSGFRVWVVILFKSRFISRIHVDPTAPVAVS